MITLIIICNFGYLLSRKSPIPKSHQFFWIRNMIGTTEKMLLNNSDAKAAKNFFFNFNMGIDEIDDKDITVTDKKKNSKSKKKKVVKIVIGNENEKNEIDDISSIINTTAEVDTVDIDITQDIPSSNLKSTDLNVEEKIEEKNSSIEINDDETITKKKKKNKNKKIIKDPTQQLKEIKDNTDDIDLMIKELEIKEAAKAIFSKETITKTKTATNNSNETNHTTTTKINNPNNQNNSSNFNNSHNNNNNYNSINNNNTNSNSQSTSSFSFKSHKDPELSDEQRQLNRYGKGKNLVAIGPKSGSDGTIGSGAKQKIRDPLWKLG